MMESARSFSPIVLRCSLRRIVSILVPPLLVLCGSVPSLAIPGAISFQAFRMTTSGSCNQIGTAGVNCVSFKTSGAASVIGAVRLTVGNVFLVPNPQPLDNGNGGFCYMTSGSGYVTGTYQGYGFSNSVSLSGMLCDVGAAGGSQPQTFNGTYLSRGYAISQGTVVWSDNGKGKILVSVKGNLKR